MKLTKMLNALLTQKSSISKVQLIKILSIIINLTKKIKLISILFSSKIKLNNNRMKNRLYFLSFKNIKPNLNILNKPQIFIRKIQTKKLKKCKFLIKTLKIDTNI